LMFDVHVCSVWGRCRSWSLCITWWNPISQCLSCGFVWKQRKTPFHSWWIYSLSSFSWCSVGLNHQFRHRNSHCCILHLSSIVRLAPAWLPYSWPARAQVDGHHAGSTSVGEPGRVLGLQGTIEIAKSIEIQRPWSKLLEHHLGWIFLRSSSARALWHQLVVSVLAFFSFWVQTIRFAAKNDTFLHDFRILRPPRGRTPWNFVRSGAEFAKVSPSPQTFPVQFSAAKWQA